MSGVVHIPWYATGFRGDQLQAELERVSALSVRYGATYYAVYRAATTATSCSRSSSSTTTSTGTDSGTAPR